MSEQLGDRIRAARVDYGMSVAELAKRIGITRQQLSMIERNKTSNPGVLTVQAIAEKLRVSLDALLGHEKMTSKERPTALALIGVEPVRQSTEKTYRHSKRSIP